MKLYALLLLALFSATLSPAESPIRIEIGVDQLRYTKTQFYVEPGTEVTINFNNTDKLAHNLVVCRGGKDAWKTLADAALKMGDVGTEKGWLPESDLILAATDMLAPHQKQSITFTAPEEDGIYPYVCTFPGHAFIMRGEMVVTRFPRGLGDLRYRYYEGSWNKLPDFSALTPAATGKLEDNKISITPRKRNDEFAFVFEGNLVAPLDGDYFFVTSSDDGSTLLIDGKLVVDNDGAHPPRQAAGRVRLSQGSHHLEVRYFEGQVTEELAVAWSGPGFPLEALSVTGADSFARAAEFQPAVIDHAKVVRVRLPDASPRSMAVGLPGGLSFCFDAESCLVRYAWKGGFVDVSPERGNGSGRGGGVCKPLGTVFGKSALPLPSGEGGSTFRFGGYRISGDAVEFDFSVDGTQVRQRISADPTGDGLVYQFTPAELPENLKTALGDRITAPTTSEN